MRRDDDMADEPGPDDEADLRQAFAALRREDAQGAPGFAAMVAEPAARRRGELVSVAGGVLAAASLVAAVLLTVTDHGPAPTPPPVASIEGWTAPTDFLLRTPGLELVQTVPKIGGDVPTLRSVSP